MVADKVSRFRAVAEMVALVGVVASLLLVAYEIRQNTAAITGATYQAMSDATADAFMDVAANPELAALVGRVFDGAAREDFSPAEFYQMGAFFIAMVRHLENTYLQSQIGTVDERIFDSYGWQDGVFRTRFFEEWWRGPGRRIVASDEFREFFEAQIGLD